MADEQRTLTPSAIKYLLALLDLCQNDAGARCMDIAEQLQDLQKRKNTAQCF